jgi:uncharacterized protein
MRRFDDAFFVSTSLSRRAFIGASAAIGAGMAFGGEGLAQAGEKSYQWGSSSLGSTGYVILTAMAQYVNKATGMKHAAISTAGGTENMVRLHGGELAFGQTTSTGWAVASAGEKPFREKIELQQMFSYTAWQTSPIVRADSSIETIADLAGKRVMPAQAGGATALTFRVLFRNAGIVDSINWTYGSWSETYDAMKTGSVDCIASLMTNGRPAPLMTELDGVVKMKPVFIPDDVYARAREENKGILIAEVTPDQWKVLTSPVKMLTEGGVLAAAKSIDAEVGYKVTKAVFDQAEELRKVGTQLRDVSLENATRWLLVGYPVNPGAAQYFKEQGVWRDDLTIG